MLKKLLIGLGLLVVFLIAAAVIVPAFVPVETYKAQIAKQVEDATGRSFAIDGKVSFSLFPTLGFEANDVTFGNAKGYTDEKMASLSAVLVAVKLMPLLGGNIEIDRFVLVDPVISLEVAKSGKPNWEFGEAGPGKAKPAPQAKAPEPSADADMGFDLAGLSLGEVRLSNGTVTYRDQTSGQAVKLSKIDMDLTLPDIAAPLLAKGSATWNGEAVAINLAVNTPETLLAGKKTPVDLQIDSKPVVLAFKGNLTNAKVLKGGGAVDLKVPSVRNLAAWAGNPLAVGETGFGPLQIKGSLGIQGARYSFADAQIAFDDIQGKGAIAFDGGGKVPHVKASLAVDRLDLNPYLPRPAGKAGASEGGASGTSAGAAAPAGKGSSGWSDAPIDATGLRAINADMDFRSGEILIRNVKIDKGAVTVTLKGGRATVALSELRLYGGQGKGTMALDASGKTLGVRQDFEIAGIQARPLLSDAVNVDFLEGGGNMTVKLASQGNSQRQLVSNLGGNGSFKFADGAIYGINVAEIVRQIGSLGLKSVLDPKSMKVEQKTDFAELSGTYVINKGIAQNSDLLMLSPLLRMTGKGSADMPNRTVNYRVEPKVVGTIKGQGGNKDLKGLTVPFTITGSWDKPQVTPDLAAMLQNDPKGAVEGILGSIPGLTKKKGAAPEGQPAAPDAGAQKKQQKPEEVLKKTLDGLFKK